MAEKDLALEDIFRFTKSKSKGICPVRCCRRRSRKNGRLCSTHNMEAWRTRNPMRAAYATLRDHACARKLEFTLTLDDFCKLCKATGYIEGKGRSPNNLSIDRRDFRQGYVPNNIRVITVSDNSIKGNKEKKIKMSWGDVPWEEIDIADYIREEESRKAKYDPRAKFQTPQSIESDDEDETSLRLSLGIKPEHEADCPF